MTAKIIIGDCRDVLSTLPDESVHCVVTSPPYFGLRDYGMAGQIGREGTPEAFVNELVSVFSEVRRVLRVDGVLFLNLGDSYASGGRATYRSGASQNKGQHVQNDMPRPRDAAGIKPKDLLGIPWMVAFALRADGWYLRSDIIWSKPNPMPESVTDRPTSAHEHLFLLAKSERYWYDAEAVKESRIYSGLANQDESGFKDPRSFEGKHSAGYRSSGKLTGGAYAPPVQAAHSNARTKKARGKALTSPRNDGNTWNENNGRGFIPTSDGRNLRNVWTIATEPYAGAHFATFPTALAEPCIKAGCPAGGVTLDPFGGSGTVGLVAERLGRDSILIELNPEYARLAEARIKAALGAVSPTGLMPLSPGPLFE